MLLEQFTCGPLATCSYLIACKKTAKAALIDAPLGITPLVQAALNQHQLELTQIILTHSHWDHIADVSKLQTLFSPQLFVHPRDYENLLHPGADGLPLFFPIDPAKATDFLQDRQTITTGHLVLEVIETPGHSPGSVCLWMKAQKTLFSGDTLFKNGMGNVSFPTSDPILMRQSLHILSQLPPETIVYPGHGPATTIQEESWIQSSSY